LGGGFDPSGGPVMITKGGAGLGGGQTGTVGGVAG
jgi:hypothetical protein